MGFYPQFSMKDSGVLSESTFKVFFDLHPDVVLRFII